MINNPDELHTGDDDLLDALTGARTALESIAEDPDVDIQEAVADALEDLTTADALRVTELKVAASRSAQPVENNTAMAISQFGQWLPIESCPANGLFLVHEDGAIRVMYRSRGEWQATALALDAWGSTTVDIKVRETGVYEPTHWMPLPLPPPPVVRSA
jgi:hypothetical protein